MFKEKIKEVARKLTPKKENIRPLITSAVITLFFFGGYYLLGSRFGEIMALTTTLLLALLLAVIVLMAEFTVLKSLFVVAAELSLLIFLAQSYCDVPSHSDTSNQAMSNLLLVGLLYIAFLFCRSLYGALREYYKKVEKEPWSKEKIGGISLFLIFTGLFIYQIYLVVSPIVLNLCVYK